MGSVVAFIFAFFVFFAPVVSHAQATPTLAVTANGQLGTLVLSQGQSFEVFWNSSATSCQFLTPLASGIPTSGSTGVIGVGHPYYPSQG